MWNLSIEQGALLETVVDVSVLKPYILDVTFSDGTRRQIDVESELYGELFEPLREPSRFSEVAVDPVLGTVVWPNGADFSPEFLYSESPRDADGHGSVHKFVDHDAGYEEWLAGHPSGFVVNAERKPRPTYLVLHRSSCRTISNLPPSGTNWTKDYIKICSSRPEPLRQWAARLGGSLHPCSFCNP